MRSERDTARPSAEVVDHYLEECLPKSVMTPLVALSGKFLGPRMLPDVDEGRLLVDLDDQSVLCRRQSATVIEQVFSAIDMGQHRDARSRGHGVSSSPLITAQYSHVQGGQQYNTILITNG